MRGLSGKVHVCTLQDAMVSSTLDLDGVTVSNRPVTVACYSLNARYTV